MAPPDRNNLVTEHLEGIAAALSLDANGAVSVEEYAMGQPRWP